MKPCRLYGCKVPDPDVQVRTVSRMDSRAISRPGIGFYR